MDALLDTAPCGFFTVADDGTVLQANTTLLNLLGYPREEVLHWHVEKLFTVGARIFYQTHIFPMLRLHGELHELYLALRDREGAAVPVLLNAARKEREGVHVNDCVVVPVHQRNQYEDELLQARKAAEEASQAKARFLSMLSHDIRAPLSTVSMLAEVLSRGAYGPVTGQQQQQLNRIQTASQYVLRLIADMLNFARLTSGRVEVTPELLTAETVMERAEALVAHQMEAAGLAYDRLPCDVTMYADPDRLQQVLLNLLTNAIKFTERGGRISVICESDGGKSHIRVQDTGRGIPADRLPYIFDPFIQVARQQGEIEKQGVGLGLAISRELMRAMGGDVTVESTVGVGSTFTVTLPDTPPQEA